MTDSIATCREQIAPLAKHNQDVLTQFDVFAESLRKIPNLSDQDLQRILDATIWSANQHKSQVRKVNNIPYIIHPLGVANYIIEVGKYYEIEVIIGALLHDTVEDTGASFEEIETRFGSVVRKYVEEVTDDKSLPKLERKRLQVVHAPHKSPGAAHIKLADKIYNTMDLTRCPPPDWTPERIAEYFDWAKQVVEGLPEVNEPLKKLFLEVHQRFVDSKKSKE